MVPGVYVEILRRSLSDRLRMTRIFFGCFRLMADFGEGLDSALDLAGDLVFGNFQIVACLKVHPKRGAVSEKAGKAEGGIRSDTTTLVDNVCDASDGDAQRQGQLVH